MAVLQGDAVADLVTVTQNALPKGDFTAEILDNDRQKLVAMDILLKKGKVKTEPSGTKLEFDIMTDDNQSAAMVGLGQVIVPNDRDVMIKGEIPWRHINWYHMVEERMVSMNRSPAKIVDYVKTRVIAGDASGMRKMEEQYWSKPASSTNTTDLFGVPYYVVYGATEGFQSGLPTGFTTIANIDPAAQDRWRNWAANYTAVSKTDLIRKMRKGAYKTDFRPPVKDIPNAVAKRRLAFFTTYEVTSKMEELLEAQNDNLGKDVASMDGQVTIFKIPVVPVPELERVATAASDPIYQLDNDSFFCVFLEGEYMNRQAPLRLPYQPRTLVTHTHCTLNTKCISRRRQAVYAKSAPFA